MDEVMRHVAKQQEVRQDQVASTIAAGSAPSGRRLTAALPAGSQQANPVVNEGPVVSDGSTGFVNIDIAVTHATLDFAEYKKHGIDDMSLYDFQHFLVGDGLGFTVVSKDPVIISESTVVEPPPPPPPTPPLAQAAEVYTAGLTPANAGAAAVAVLQAVFMGFIMGPPICFIGTIAPKAIIVVQSFLQLGYTDLFESIMGANMLSYGTLFQKTYTLLLGAAMLALAALSQVRVDAVNKALLTGRLLIMPLVFSISSSMFQSVSHCQLFAAPTEEFPFGQPYLCDDKFSGNYLLSLYSYHGLKWLVIFAITYFSGQYEQQIVVLSSAVSGASLMSSSYSMVVTMLRRLQAANLLEARNIGPEVQSQATIIYYVLVVLGSLSQFMMRDYVAALGDQEAIHEELGVFKGIGKQVKKMLKDMTADENLKKDLMLMKGKTGSLIDGTIAKMELFMADLSPIPNPSRKLMAYRLQAQLKSGGSMPTALWERMVTKLDPDGDAADRSAFNEKIWKMKVKMPKVDGQTEYGTDENGMISMKGYHEALIDKYSKACDAIPGRETLFKNQILPLIWPKVLRFPYGSYTEDYQLGHCEWAPFRWFVVMIVGPAFKNYFLFNPIGFLWCYPLIKFNLFIMYLQFSGKSASQHFWAFMRIFPCYRCYLRMKSKWASMMAGNFLTASSGAPKVAPAPPPKPTPEELAKKAEMEAAAEAKAIAGDGDAAVLQNQNTSLKMEIEMLSSKCHELEKKLEFEKEKFDKHAAMETVPVTELPAIPTLISVASA